MEFKTLDLDDKVNKTCFMLHTVTKMDVRFINHQGILSLQLVNHHNPAVIDNVEEEFTKFPSILEQHPSNSFYHHKSVYGLEYISAGIWDKEDLCGSIVIGPFIMNSSTTDSINPKIAEHRLPVYQRTQLSYFFESLPVISMKEFEAMGELLVNLCHHERFPVQQIFTMPQEPASINREKLIGNLDENKKFIERMYEAEKKWMDDISKGDKRAISTLLTEKGFLSFFSNRVPGNPLRASKNITLISNTMCRMAAEKGGVHPVYIHRISEKYAILIEKVQTIKQLNHLISLMFYEYCDLVNTHSTRHCSPMVKKAVNYIKFNLETPMTLNEIALAINANATHLSRKFKEDTKMNVIEFIQYRRVEEAKYFLKRGNKTISDVALLVGFSDENYFARVFKKVTSLTPSQYKKSMIN